MSKDELLIRIHALEYVLAYLQHEPYDNTVYIQALSAVLEEQFMAFEGAGGTRSDL